LHAYAHQWECQLVFNPRMLHGAGLTDGEGTERFWSRMRKLIGVLRHVSRGRRLVILERHADWVAKGIRDDLGRWLVRRSKAIIERRWAARMELRRQVAAVRTQLNALRASQRGLHDEAEELYGSLNVGDVFPAIAEYGYEFVKTLVKAFDAKCDFRARITGRFFEWERLDRAVGGHGTPLGTAEHQRTMRSIKKRTPALVNALNRYNGLCDDLKRLLPDGRDFPLPQKLPTDFALLKDDPALLEDVWLSGVPGDSVPWLMDARVRRGIRAQHIVDRCEEEYARVETEESNLFAWITAKSAAIHVALSHPSSALTSVHFRNEAHLL
ncbi:hypothetical protein EXIGLDRAFT_627886, partial [Exidia glandulosa HHB12029]